MSAHPGSPDRYLVKEIRANLMLGFVYRKFKCPIAIIDPLERLTRWKDQLGRREQMRILDWAKRLRLEMYDSEPLPRR